MSFHHSRARWLALVTAISLLMLTVAACDGTGSSTSPAATSQPVATATPKPQPITSAKLNQEIRYWTDAHDVDVGATPTSAKQSNGGEYETPSSGHIFIVVHVTLKNYSNQDYNYNPLDFSVLDKNGNLTESSFYSFAQQPLDYGTLAPGGTVSGNVVFEAPTNLVSGLKLAWKPTFDSPKSKYTWELGL